MSTLSNEEILRYSRHLIMPEVGMAGQEKLKASSVLLIGAGGLGSPLAMYLAAAGVGKLGIVDFDVVDHSNLHRQVIHSSANVGKPKVDSAKQRVAEINPNVEVVTYMHPINRDNVLGILKDYDMVIDGTDNFPTRFLLNDACYFAAKTLVSAAVTEFEGQLATYKAFDKTGPHPCYRCLFPEPPPPGTMPSCSETGVLGAAAGVMGSLAALEALKEVAGIGASLAGKVLTYRALTTEFRTARLPPDPACPLCGGDPVIRDLRVHAG